MDERTNIPQLFETVLFLPGTNLAVQAITVPARSFADSLMLGSPRPFSRLLASNRSPSSGRKATRWTASRSTWLPWRPRRNSCSFENPSQSPTLPTPQRDSKSPHSTYWMNRSSRSNNHRSPRNHWAD